MDLRSVRRQNFLPNSADLPLLWANLFLLWAGRIEQSARGVSTSCLPVQSIQPGQIAERSGQNADTGLYPGARILCCLLSHQCCASEQPQSQYRQADLPETSGIPCNGYAAVRAVAYRFRRLSAQRSVTPREVALGPKDWLYSGLLVRPIHQHLAP